MAPDRPLSSAGSRVRLAMEIVRGLPDRTWYYVPPVLHTDDVPASSANARERCVAIIEPNASNRLRFILWDRKKRRYSHQYQDMQLRDKLFDARTKYPAGTFGRKHRKGIVRSIKETEMTYEWER